ncbi:MAG: hypothetical protein M1820_003848 [Bogoriella megaspora]|nr:MAG: hypothetical protein M1820_003848 [Bogoriella megaspora]
MSRRPNPGADRAEQNRQTLKSLVKLESNKSCADCKRNKHPRWASWNLGIFVCIRCSGIHRGMGTHISRVKSVDLDAWTDEQLQNMLRWGNSRANKSVIVLGNLGLKTKCERYWEAKLAPGHVPAEAYEFFSLHYYIQNSPVDSKIENFIRTKYDSKRWVMDGGMPDPSTLDVDGDDDIPLNVVKEKAQLERSASQKATAPTKAAAPSRAPPPVDLFGDDVQPAPPRPSTTEPSFARAPPPPKVEPAKQPSKQNDSLLGLDFLGGGAAAPLARPNSATSPAANSSVPSRPDLKQSILSLYASAPRQQPQQPAGQHGHIPSFGAPQSPPAQAPQSSAFGGLNDAFSGLSFSSTPLQTVQPQAPKPSPFANLASPPINKSTPSNSTSFGGGGNFFNSTPRSPPPAPKPATVQPVPQPVPQPVTSPLDEFGDFSSATSPISQQPAQKPKSIPVPPATSSPGMDDLFDLNAPAPPPASTKPKSPSKPPENFGSPFNLSSPTAPSAQPPKPSATPSNPPLPTASTFSNMDAWGSNEAWGTPDPAPVPAPKVEAQRPAPVTAPSGADLGGWGAATTTKPAEPKISADEDFGGWSSAPGPTSPGVSNPAAGTGATKPVGGFGGSDDLFSNVWE